ncbi:MAG TPA: hypothetical protein VEJ36_05280, partial [Nitrososphaerales archaeon]|nr:hypothetical protein [Nitrososphaerales archaeon]
METKHSLRSLSTQDPTLANKSSPEIPSLVLRRFAHRLRHERGNGLRSPIAVAENEAIDKDPALQAHYEVLKSRRGNCGIISLGSIRDIHAGLKAFLRYTDIPITDHAY